jgi:hypothetical protein
MLEMDGGVSVAELYILAECSERAGDVEAARKYLEMARDAASWDTSRVAIPRPFSSTQKAVREEVSRYKGAQLIDLPELFREHLGGGIPGRRLIIDYCHLTTEGIRVAMAAASSCVLRALSGAEVPWRALATENVAPPSEIEAEACFLAAVLNAHCFQPYEIVRHYCSLALKLSPHIAGVMTDYLELQNRPLVPAMMTESEEKIYRQGSPLIHHYLLRLNEKRLERVLYDAAVDALEEAGFDARSRLDLLRREEHSVTHADKNLLDYYYCSATSHPQELTWSAPTGERRFRHDADYYKAYWPESRFVFFAEAGRPALLNLTCRLPSPAPAAGTVSLEVNRRPQAQLAVTHEWGTWELTLPGEAVREGLNEVTVRWPVPEFPGEKALDRVRPNLLERKFPDFYPVFGEIHSFTASDGLKASGGDAPAEREMAAIEVS